MGYKIFDIHTDERGNQFPKTLFHGVKGSRRLPIGKWIESERKWVSDGGKFYWSGFHVYETMNDVKQWLKGARNLENRVVVKVLSKDCHLKTHAIRHTRLAKFMCIPKSAWDQRIEAKDLR